MRIEMTPTGDNPPDSLHVVIEVPLGGEPVISPSIYSAIVAMVIVTTMVTPPALTWSLSRRRRANEEPAQ